MRRPSRTLCLVFAFGCYGSFEGGSDTGGGGIDGGRPPTIRDSGPIRGDEGPPPPPRPGEESDHDFVLQLVDVHREDDRGRIRGANIDGRISDETDPLGCNQEDFQDPIDGERGVDSQLSVLVPTIEAALGSDLRDTLVGIPRAPLRLEGVDPSRNDPDIRVILEGSVTRTSMTDGRFEAQLPVTIPAWAFGLTPLHEVGLKARLAADGRLEDIAVFGIHTLEEITEGARMIAPDIDPELIRTTLEGVADLEPGPGGICRALSASYVAEAIR